MPARPRLLTPAQRKDIRRLYLTLGSGNAVAVVLGIPRSTVYHELARVRMLRSHAEGARIARTARQRKAADRGLAMLRVLWQRKPDGTDPTLAEAARAVGIPAGVERRALAAACRHLGLDYDTTRTSAPGSRSSRRPVSA